MQIRKKRLMLPFLVPLLLSACSTAPKKPHNLSQGDYSYARQYLSWLIEKEMKDANVPAVSIALVDDQRIVWSAGFGYADVAGKKQASGKTLYRAGSISKLFTATAAMQLVEQGNMDIDAPLTTYLPAFSIKSRFESDIKITPRHLMTHHAGLPNSRNAGMWVDNPEPYTRLVEQIRDEYVALPPRQAFLYSNLGYSLLGHAVATVAGREYAQHMEQALFQPLNMHDSSFQPSTEHMAMMATGYRDGAAVELVGLRDVPAGALHTSVEDLSQFVKMVFANGASGGRQIIQADTLTEMLARQNADVALDFDLEMGLAWFLESKSKVGGERKASHAGGTLLYHSQLAILPDHKLGVIVLSNAASGRAVVDKVADAALKLALEVTTGRKPADNNTEELPALVDAMENLPFPLEGYYAGAAGLIEVERKDRQYTARAIGKNLSLRARKGGWMSPQYKLLGLIPLSVSGLDGLLIRPAVINGRQVLVLRSGGREFLLAEKISKKAIPEKIHNWLGRLRIRNPDSAMPIEDIELAVEDGLIIVRYRMPVFADQQIKMALLPVADDAVVIAGIGRGMGETMRLLQRDGEQFLLYSGYEIVRATAQ